MILASAILTSVAIVIGIFCMIEAVYDSCRVVLLIVKILCFAAAATLAIVGGVLVIGIILAVLAVIGAVCNILALCRVISYALGIINILVAVGKSVCAVLLFVAYF